MRNAEEASAKPSFYFPVAADTDTVLVNDVILILGQPENVYGMKRMASEKIFEADFSWFTVK